MQFTLLYYTRKIFFVFHLGALAVSVAETIRPFGLAVAAGAMIFIVADDILPEAHSSGNGMLATWGCILGFFVMMCLDVGLA